MKTKQKRNNKWNVARHGPLIQEVHVKMDMFDKNKVEKFQCACGRKIHCGFLFCLHCDSAMLYDNPKSPTKSEVPNQHDNPSYVSRSPQRSTAMQQSPSDFASAASTPRSTSTSIRDRRMLNNEAPVSWANDTEEAMGSFEDGCKMAETQSEVDFESANEG